MATIQVRDVPEDVHRTFRRRAAEAGMSMQEYVLTELSRIARNKTPAEVIAEVRASMAAEGPAGYATESSVDIIRADRESH